MTATTYIRHCIESVARTVARPRSIAHALLPAMSGYMGHLPMEHRLFHYQMLLPAMSVYMGHLPIEHRLFHYQMLLPAMSVYMGHLPMEHRLFHINSSHVGSRVVSRREMRERWNGP